MATAGTTYYIALAHRVRRAVRPRSTADLLHKFGHMYSRRFLLLIHAWLVLGRRPRYSVVCKAINYSLVLSVCVRELAAAARLS
jgi:hypothetical protein